MLLWKRRRLRKASKAGQEELIFRHVLLSADLAVLNLAVRVKQNVWIHLGSEIKHGRRLQSKKRQEIDKHEKMAIGYTVA